MLDDLNNIVNALADSSAGWVARRDAAEALGQIAQTSLTALRSHKDEGDVDVRVAVERALASIGAGASNVAATAARGASEEPTLKELAQACEKKLRRAIKPEDDGYLVRVQMKQGRTQDVIIQPHKRSDGREMIRASTQCGKPDAETIAWAIRSNDKLSYCAFSIHGEGEEERLVIVKNFDPARVTGEMVKDAVKEIAFYGDWMEKKLTGEDNF
jgi:hypothetical protein